MLVAISGGPDSTALLLALAASGHDVVAAHFDHALRESSRDDAAFVGALAGELRVPLIAGRRSDPLPRGSLQAAARTARYRFLEDARARVDAAVIVTAHTRDDHVETILMNILRGSGVDGLRGIPSRHGSIVRPLLDVTRDNVTAYLAAEHPALTPRRDPSNENLRFLRARVRHLLLPHLEATVPDVVAKLVRIAHHAQRAHDRLAHSAALDAAEPAARAAALRDIYAAAGGATPGLARNHLREMDRLLSTRRRGAQVDLPGGVRFVVDASQGRVIDGPTRAKPPAAPTPPALSEHPCDGCLDTDDDLSPVASARGRRPAIHITTTRPLALRTRAETGPGLRIRTRIGTKKLQDVFVDAKVPHEDRDAYPLVFLEDRLIWVPGLAADPSYTAPTTIAGRHISIEIGPEKPVVRSDDQSPRSPL